MNRRKRSEWGGRGENETRQRPGSAKTNNHRATLAPPTGSLMAVADWW